MTDKSSAPPPYGQATQPGYPNQQAPPPAYYTAQNPQPAYTQPTQQTTVITTQPVVNMTIMSEVPMAMVCPYCRANISTRVEYVNGTLTWLAVLLICVLGGGLGCCLIPLCIDSLKDVYHYCPNCNHHLGTKTRM